MRTRKRVDSVEPDISYIHILYCPDLVLVLTVGGIFVSSVSSLCSFMILFHYPYVAIFGKELKALCGFSFM